MITRLKLSTIEQGLPKYRSMLAGNDAYLPSSFESIATATGTGSSGTITLSSIPSTYQHLQIRCLLKSTGTSTGLSGGDLRFNGNNTNYLCHTLSGNGTTVTAAANTGLSAIALDNAAPQSGSGLSNMMGVMIIDIHDYASTTKNKTVRAMYGVSTNGTVTADQMYLMSGLWINTSAINQISFISGTANWTSTTKIALYGVKA
jgi:hypothetical protein